MKTFKKKALLPAIAMVLVSVIALSGVSYAWFTLSSKATVGELSLNVATAKGLQISLDGVNWVSSISAEDISTKGYTGNINQTPTGAVVPVSTAGDVVNGHMQMFDGVTNDGTVLTTTLANANAGTGGNYYAFDLFFQITEDEVTLQLDAGSYVKAFTNTDPAEAAETSYASRVAFVNFGAANNAVDARKLTEVSSKVIWEPSAKMHAEAAIAKDATIDGAKVAYKGVNAAAADFDPNGTANLAAVTTADYDENEGATAGVNDLFTLSKGINKVRVYIWLEGQDVDCINEVSGNILKTMLKFCRPE